MEGGGGGGEAKFIMMGGRRGRQHLYGGEGRQHYIDMSQNVILFVMLEEVTALCVPLRPLFIRRLEASEVPLFKASE